MAVFSPRNGGQYCVGRRMKFRSCNSEPCSRQRRDFREEQCSAFDGRHFNINGLPPNVRWVPKYSGSKTFALVPFSRGKKLFLFVVLIGYRFNSMLSSKGKYKISRKLLPFLKAQEIEALCLLKKKKPKLV